MKNWFGVRIHIEFCVNIKKKIKNFQMRATSITFRPIQTFEAGFQESIRDKGPSKTSPPFKEASNTQKTLNLTSSEKFWYSLFSGCHTVTVNKAEYAFRALLFLSGVSNNDKSIKFPFKIEFFKQKTHRVLHTKAFCLPWIQISQYWRRRIRPSQSFSVLRRPA